MSMTDVSAAPGGERVIYGKVLPADAVLRASQQGPVVSNRQGIAKISFVEYKAMFVQGARLTANWIHPSLEQH